VEPDPSPALDLAVRENATWCDLVCRLVRLTPTADVSMWWTNQRAPDRFPDAVTLTRDASNFDVLSRIHDSAGASVKDSFAALDLTHDGYRALFDASWIARPPGAVATDAATVPRVTDKFRFAAWRYAVDATEDMLPNGLLRAGGVTVIGAHNEDVFTDGAILHLTRIGGTEVVGLSNVFGTFRTAATTASAMFPAAWIVGYERGDTLTEALTCGFEEVGPLRVWLRSS